MREIPKPGQIYRHFKGHLYQITAIARHSETLEALVIYQALYGDFQYYARPLHMFMDELDKEKYSGVTQRDRFELVRTVMDEIELEPVELQQSNESEVQTAKAAQAEKVIEITADSAAGDVKVTEAAQVSETKSAKTDHVNEAPQLDAGVEEFLDAGSFEEKLRIFTGMQHRLTDDMINVMAISMDTEVPEGELGDRITSLKNFLLTQVKFECNRIR